MELFQLDGEVYTSLNISTEHIFSRFISRQSKVFKEL